MTTATTLDRAPAAAFPAPAPPFSDFAGFPPSMPGPPQARGTHRRWRQLFALFALLAVCATVALSATDGIGDATPTSRPSAVELEPVEDDNKPPLKDKPAAPSLFTNEASATSSGAPATEACSDRPQWLPLPCLQTKP